MTIAAMDHEHCSSLPRSRSHRPHKRAPGGERCRRRPALDVRRKHVVTEYPNLLSDSRPSRELPRIPLNSPPGGASRGAFSRVFVGPARLPREGHAGDCRIGAPTRACSGEGAFSCERIGRVKCQSRAMEDRKRSFASLFRRSRVRSGAVVAQGQSTSLVRTGSVVRFHSTAPQFQTVRCPAVDLWQSRGNHQEELTTTETPDIE